MSGYVRQRPGRKNQRREGGTGRELARGTAGVMDALGPEGWCGDRLAAGTSLGQGGVLRP